MPLRISVVIPSYKSSAFIEATLDSVIQQTYPRDFIELLVIDDASPDNSAAVARAFLARHSINSRVVVQEVNGGAAVTRNTGWKLATGEWIQFLDQDDLLAPHKIELQAQLAARSDENVAVIYSNWQHFLLENGIWRASGSLYAPNVDADPILQILQELDFGYVGPTLIRKSYLSKIGGFDEKPNLGEDCDLMLRIAMAGGRFREARSERAAFFYRQSPNSLWRSYIKNTEAMGNLLNGFRNVELFLRQKSENGNLSADERAAIAKRYSRFIDLYFEQDIEKFHVLMGWLKELGYSTPTQEIRPRFRMLATVIGYENALRLRTAFQRYSRQGGMHETHR